VRFRPAPRGALSTGLDTSVITLFSGSPRETLGRLIRLLVSSPDDQIAWLVRHGFDADELAILYIEDLEGPLKPLQDSGELSAPAAETVTALGSLLKDLLDRKNAADFTDEGVRTSNSWKEIRAAAACAHTALNDAR